MRLIGIGLVSLLVLTACGDGGDQTPAGEPAPTVPSATGPSVTASERDQVEVAVVYERVEYYGACGNETLTVGGVNYYPIHNETFPGNDQGPPYIDVDRYPVVGAVVGIVGSVVSALTPAPKVAPPGPGDDIGDLVVFVDGIARFESDSGWVIWLTDEQQTYGWDC